MTTAARQSPIRTEHDPDVAARYARGRRAWTVALAFGFVVGTTLLALMRQSGTASVDTMYAEDGDRFLTDALADNSLVTIFKTYAGYLHVLPRSIAAVTAILPLEWAAFAMAASSAVIVAVLALYVYDASSEWIASRLGRFVIAATMVALPSIALQSLANTTNLHYFLFFACFWTLVRTPQPGARRVADWVIVLATVLSSGLSVLLAPIALFRLFKRRKWSAQRLDVALLVVFIVGALVHVGVVVLEAPMIRERPVVISGFVGLYGLRVIGSILLGERLMPWLVDSSGLEVGWALSLITALVIASLGAYVLMRRDLHARVVLAAALVYSVVMYAAPAIGRGMHAALPDSGGYRFLLARYFVISGLFLVVVVVGLLADRDPRVSPSTWRRIQIGVAACVAFAALSSLSIPNDRSPGPGWSAQVDAARARCAAGAESVRIHHAPRPYLRKWYVQVACAKLQTDGQRSP